MLEFAARHDIKPMTEHFPIGEVNAAFDHLLSVLREGKHLEKALRALFGLTEPDLYVIPVW